MTRETEETKLARCPFCGGDALVKSGNIRNKSVTERAAWAVCERCGARTAYVRKALYADYAERAAALWDMRWYEEVEG